MLRKTTKKILKEESAKTPVNTIKKIKKITSKRMIKRKVRETNPQKAIRLRKMKKKINLKDYLPLQDKIRRKKMREGDQEAPAENE